MQAYCMKCRKKVEIKSPKAITMKNKKPATQGVCPTCGTKVFRIGKAQVRTNEGGPLNRVFPHIWQFKILEKEPQHFVSVKWSF